MDREAQRQQSGHRSLIIQDAISSKPLAKGSSDTSHASLPCYLLGLWSIIIHDTEQDCAQSTQLLFASDFTSWRPTV